MAKKKKPRHPIMGSRPGAVSRNEPPTRIVWVCVLLVAFVAIIYGQTLRHDFINYDDEGYVTENVHVLNGLNWADVKWAFTTGHTGYAHPVTWLTHQLDVELYGTWAGGHHLNSWLLHAINSVLLFLFFWRTTNKLWPSAFVAAIFAIHPLHVESVAWVAERKDVLSGFFFLVTLHAYAWYAARPKPSRFALAVGLYVLGILSKPTLVTMPCVLLLVDYWPLRRIEFHSPEDKSRKFTIPWPVIRRLLLEKTPFAIVAIAWSATTYFLQGEYGALVEDKLGIGLRISNAIVSYGIYLWKTVWAHNLALFYPYPTSVPVGAVLISALALVLISLLCLSQWRKLPPVLVGWLWFIGMLVPVIGFIGFGSQARADRYNYLPHIGLCVAITWGILTLSEKWKYKREILSVVSLIAIAMFTVRAYTQVAYWRNNETLWNHSLAVTSDNYLAENNLGNHFTHTGRMAEALVHFKRSLAISPHYPEANNNLGTILTNEGKFAEATDYFEISLKYRPNHAKTHSNIGVSLTETGRLEEARAHFNRAIELDPFLVDAHFNYARLLLMTDKRDEAIAQLREVLRLKPDDAEARTQLNMLTGGM